MLGYLYLASLQGIIYISEEKELLERITEILKAYYMLIPRCATKYILKC